MTFKEYQERVVGSESFDSHEAMVFDAMRMTIFAGIILDQTEDFVMVGRIIPGAWAESLGSILWHTVSLSKRAEVTLRPDWPRIVPPVPKRGEFEYEWLERRARLLAKRVSNVVATVHFGEYHDLADRLHRVVEAVVELCRWLDVPVEKVAMAYPVAPVKQTNGRIYPPYAHPSQRPRMSAWLAESPKG